MLSRNKWWVKKNLLFSGLDPGDELGRVADHIGDEYTPMLFMTGDGHGHPPFAWTAKGVWPGFFGEMARLNNICCHVEKFSDAVTQDDVPITLRSVFNNGKVFGWEPDFYKGLKEVMEICFKVMSDATVALGVMGKIANTINGLTRWVPLHTEAGVVTEYYLKAMALKVDPVPMSKLPGYDEYLGKFAGTRAMALRTEIHQYVGANIQRIVDRYPDHVHLITCGDAHILTTCRDPLYLHVNPPVGTFGVADENKK